MPLTGKQSRGADVLHLFNKLIPDVESRQLEEAVDIAHRVGSKEDNKARPVLLLFTRRLVREETWRRSKESTVFKEGGIRLAEMLPREDREARKKLWPQIEGARREGKRAHYRGPHSYIEGGQIGCVLFLRPCFCTSQHNSLKAIIRSLLVYRICYQKCPSILFPLFLFQ